MPSGPELIALKGETPPERLLLDGIRMALEVREASALLERELGDLDSGCSRYCRLQRELRFD